MCVLIIRRYNEKNNNYFRYTSNYNNCISIFLNKNNYNFFKIGNNKSNKEISDIEDYILNIDSYEAQVEVNVISNKNSNKYLINQKYKSPNIFTQKVIEPSNIKDVTIEYDGSNLKIINTELNLNKIYENYPYISNNILNLESFIEDYKSSNESKYEVKDEDIILETKIKNGNKYIYCKKLYVKKNGEIIKMEVQDVTKNTLVYILYNEIKINNLQKEDVLAYNIQRKNK